METPIEKAVRAQCTIDSALARCITMSRVHSNITRFRDILDEQFSLANAYTNAGHHIFCCVVAQDILYTSLLVNHPLVGLEQDGIRERYEVRGKHSDDIAHARDRGTSSVVDDLLQSQPASEKGP